MEYAIALALRIYLWFSLAALIVYLPRISFYFAPFKKQKRLVNPKKNKIAVIIPARNESRIISHCLDSFMAQTYDPAYFDIHIAIAEENDPTAEIAAAYERVFVTAISGQNRKGDALDGILKKILAEAPAKYEAFLIVDADNLAAPDLLEEMNNALASGKQIICGKKLIKNWYSRRRESRSFVSNCTSLIYTLVDELGNRARNALGATVTMIGTGMMVRADVIKENNGWPYRSLTEDYEMTADAIAKGRTSMYYSYARVYTEEALSAKTAYRRKVRWIKGHVECKRMYRKKILKKIFSGKSSLWHLDFVFGTAPVAAFFGVSVGAVICGLVAVGLSLAGQAIGLGLALRLALIPAGLSYAAMFAFTLVTLIADWRNIRIPLHEKLAILFFNPIYSVGYFRIYIAAYIINSDYFKWEATDRIPGEFIELPSSKN